MHSLRAPGAESVGMSTRHIHANFIARLEAERAAHIARCIATIEYMALMRRLQVAVRS